MPDVTHAHDAASHHAPAEYVHVSIVGPAPRTFHLVRETDVSGVSGTGTVAAGVIWADGTVSMRWMTYVASTSTYASIEDVEAIHGHQGATRVEFPEADRLTSTFRMLRHHDRNSGKSSHVADGAEWVDGTVSIRWRGDRPSTVFWASLDDAFSVHNHDKLTEINFLHPQEDGE